MRTLFEESNDLVDKFHQADSQWIATFLQSFGSRTSQIKIEFYIKKIIWIVLKKVTTPCYQTKVIQLYN